MANTLHFDNERQKREAFIKEIGEGKVIDEFEWISNKPDKPEIHKVTDTGIILVYGKTTGKLITKLIARPRQISRLYKSVGRKAPQWLMAKAGSNKDKGYNQR